MSTFPTYNLVDMFEFAVDSFGDTEFIVADDKRATYHELEQRANALAHYLTSIGIVPGDHVGIYAKNCLEWVESMFAIFKLRAVFININYRYVDKELLHVFNDSDIKALIYHQGFSEHVQRVANKIPKLQDYIVIKDDSAIDIGRVTNAVEYEEALSAHSTKRDFGPRSGDDHYLLFTGGTTGLPKAVVWRHEDVFFALGGGVDPTTGHRVSNPKELVLKAKDNDGGAFLNPAPLMHGACQWGVIGGAYNRRKSILVSQFDADTIWHLVGREKVNGLMITGDAMARPLADLLKEKQSDYSLDSLFLLASTAATFSISIKREFLKYLPQLIILDGVGASESGSTGMTSVTAKDTEHLVSKSGGLTVKPVANSVVLDESLAVIAAGDDRVGKLARTGNIPLGYYKDPKKSAEVFVFAADGKRYAMPGDYAKMEPDGSITLLGRGSACINSGGMKIYPEEVEQAVKAHADVFDAIVVGVKDEQWGETVAVALQTRPKRDLTLSALQAHCREHLAGYKIPRLLKIVPDVVRSPSGKPDYRWARDCFNNESTDN